MSDDAVDVPSLLPALREGDQRALERLLPLVYDELRRVAAGYLRYERPDHTLQPTALVHEAYMRLVGQRDVVWQNRAHLVGVAARQMRRILLDHARAHRAEKRAGHLARVTLDDVHAPAAARDVDLLALDVALAELDARDPQHARLVELKYFGGLTTRELAEVLGISPATVEREWAHARAWLFLHLQGERP
jgi:RNA polymerase sigma factor (TIGR02999 family)